ncbi:MAG: histidine kinase dimerization/phospho-acceptor domain-containing protein, partial [Candidatus Competibacteraceae bacterium]|nr:histidine kinase dimerization/phospho-acceptor domain-containing protein [Candidatus Competibacteraceae bacterium]
MNPANRNDFNWQTPFQNVLSGSAMDRRRAWYVLRAFNIYRLVMALILLCIYLLDQRSRVFGKDDPTLFLWTTLLYMAVVLLAIVGSFLRRPAFSWQTHLQTLVDLIALSLLIHASGGITSSLSILLVTAIAASGILLPLYSALAAAALAFFIMLGYWFLDSSDFALSGWNDAVSFSNWIAGFFQNRTDTLGRVGILGASFFIAALLTYTLAERARRSDALVHERSRELLEMAELNQVIIRHLQSGIIVVDNFARVRLINDKARELLNYTLPIQGSALRDVSPQLSQDLTTWLVAETAPKPFRQAQHLPDITPTFSLLGSSQTADTLIFLEDTTQVVQRLQQIKLAALGRMTAGIAHEIRNPLTAISHAAQLLQESIILSDSDQRLGEIIHINVKRANRIISDVLDLSRRDQIKQEDVV